MFDLETLGTEPGAVILSIGAVQFDLDGINDEFYRSVSAQSCQDAGLAIDARTIEWWLDQEDEVQDILIGGDGLAEVLDDFADFYGDADEIWARGPQFDCKILGHAYEAIGAETPWHYSDPRDQRTISSLPGYEEPDNVGDEHNALDDAKYQARSVIQTLEPLYAEATC